MNVTSTHPDAMPAPGQRAPGRLTIDAPVRAFHALFALSFAGAWMTAEAEQWHGLHVTLGYAFGGLLAFRLVYGLIGPRQARLAVLWRRACGWAAWFSSARAGQLDLSRALTLAMGTAMLLLIAVAAPLVLTGYAAHVEWMNLDDVFEEVHEFFANAAMSLVLAHLALIGALSVLRRRNLAAPMLTGRVPGAGPDLVRANRAWLGALVLATYAGFVGWQTLASDWPGQAATREHHGHRADHADHDD